MTSGIARAGATMACMLGATAPLSSQILLPPDRTAQAAEDAGAIVVTGTRIDRPDLATASPVAALGADEIARRQPNTLEDALRTLPSFRPNYGAAFNNGGDGSARLDLRGLGPNRTLVLLDGKRIVPFGLDGIVDINALPVNLVERVDVVTGGASSVYGADAVAGVVNVVTRRGFTGLEASANVGISQRGDGATKRADLLFGTRLGAHGHLLLSGEVARRSALPATDRGFSSVMVNSATGQFLGSQATVPVLFVSPSPAALGIGAAPLGAIYDPALGRLRAARTGDLFNAQIGNYLITPATRQNLYAAADYELTPGVEIYGDARWARDAVRMQVGPSGSFTSLYSLPLDNAYLPAGVRDQLCSASRLGTAQCAAAAAAPPGSPGYREVPVIAQRRFVELGNRINTVTSTQYQLLAGVRGPIFPTLRYDVSIQYGATDQRQLREHFGSYARLQQALRSYRDADGRAMCADPAGGCVPFDLFAPAGGVGADMLDFVDLATRIRRHVSLTVATGSVGGEVPGLASPLAASPVAFSIGAEYRRLVASTGPDAASQLQGEVLGSGARILSDRGRVVSRELFGELIAPLVEDRPLFHRLQAEAGIRYSDDRTTGGSTTWKAGGRYEPARGLALRAMYQVAIRAPNIAELFQSPVQGIGALAADPCQGAAPAANAALAALCIATGAPAATIGSIAAPASGQINLTVQGNRALRPERARTLTAGAVLAPPQLPGLSLSLDYFRIRIAHAITQPATGDVLNGCFSPALNPGYADNAFCSFVVRNRVTGGLSGDAPGVLLSYSNLGRIATAGIDLGAAYGIDLPYAGTAASRLQLSVYGTWLDYFHSQANPNAIDRDCTGYYSANCNSPRPRWKWNARATLTHGVADLSVLWTHVAAARLEPYHASAIRPLTTPQPGGPDPATVFAAYRRIPAYDAFDASVRLRLSRFELGLLVSNLLDRKPPLIGATAGGAFGNANTFPTSYDAIGRNFTLSVRVSI